jgi:hypothetical protein
VPHFLLVCSESSQPVGAVVMEAPSMLQAHTNAVARDLAGGLAFGEVHELTAKMAATIPPEQIDRILSGKEATQLILRLVEDRGKAEEMTGRFPRPWRVVEHAASFTVQDAMGQNVESPDADRVYAEVVWGLKRLRAARWLPACGPLLPR